MNEYKKDKTYTSHPCSEPKNILAIMNRYQPELIYLRTARRAQVQSTLKSHNTETLSPTKTMTDTIDHLYAKFRPLIPAFNAFDSTKAFF